MIVIGLSGKAGSGKNHLADLVKAKYEGVKLFVCATSLKIICAEMSGLPLEDMYTSEGKAKETWITWEMLNLREEKYYNRKGFLTVRDLQQVVGTEVLRDGFSVNYHVNKLVASIQASNCKIAIVTDVRFKNEAGAIAGLGGHNIRMTGRGGIAGGHVSEDVMFQEDGLILNGPNHDNASLMVQLESILPELKECETNG